MDTQAYRVAVLLTLNDQLSKNLAKIGTDAKELGGKFDAINKSILAIKKSSEAASKALDKLNRSLNSPASSQALGAKTYADSMERAAKAAKQIASTAPASNAMIGGLVGIAATSSIAARTSTATMLPSSGGGRMLPPAGGALLLTGPGGGSWKGWKNGVPPGGWGPGGGGGGGGGGNGPGNGRIGGGGSRQYGMENLAIAYGGFEFMKSAVETGAEYQTMLQKFKQYGMGDAAVAEAEKFAKANKMLGASSLDMLKYFTEAQGVFRESGANTLDEQLKGARIAAPVMAKMQVAMQGLDEHAREMTSAKQMDMLRFVEQAGGLHSATRFNELMDAGFKAIQSSGGNVDFTQYRQFMSKAKTSAFGMDDIAIFAEMEPIIGELKGSAAGDAYMTAYNRAHGITTPTHQAAKEWLKLGLWDKSKVSFNSQGRLNITGDPLKDKGLFDKSQVRFYMQDVLPRYRALNYSEEDIRRTNAILFGRTGGGMYNLIDKQLSTILAGIPGFQRFRGLDDSYNAVNGTYTGKQIDFDAKWKEFQLALAQDGGLLDTFTKGLTGMTTFLQKLTEFSNANPRITGTVMTLLEMVTVMATLKGGLWLVKHAASALFSPLELITGTKGIPLLTSSLGGLYGIVARLVPLLGLFIPTNNTPNTTEELKTIQSKGAENWSKSNPGKPFAGTWQTQVMEWMDKHPGEPLSNYKGSQGGTAYPEPAKSSQTIQVNSSVYLDRNKVGDALTQHIIKQASRAPTGPSGVDSSMNLIHAGMGSLVPR